MLTRRLLIPFLLLPTLVFSGCQPQQKKAADSNDSKENILDVKLDDVENVKSSELELQVAILRDQNKQLESKIKELKEKETSALRHEDLDATLWIQTSGEYAAITQQAYHLAAESLGDRLLDPTWTACLEQRELVEAGEVELSSLPPAVIFDVDETVLDNTGYQVELIKNKTEYSRESWKAFCITETSKAIPGAVDFVERCRAAGVHVIFLTNREHEVENHTQANLMAVGLLHEDDGDVVYSKYEMEDWKSDKTSRRKHLSQKYRILLLVGDDLHDFASTGEHPAHSVRRKIALENHEMWGHGWIAMPNPNYGGWEQSLYDWDYNTSSAERLQRKRDSMVVVEAKVTTAQHASPPEQKKVTEEKVNKEPPMKNARTKLKAPNTGG